MYSLETPLRLVKGIGPTIADALAARELRTVKDVLLFVPLHYEDRSLKKMIYQLTPNEVVTIAAEVVSSSNFYKGRRSIQSATVADHTGRLKLMWFNNPHVLGRVVKGKKLWISGKLNDRGTMIQPTIESFVESADGMAGGQETIHTGRLVPVYSGVTGVAPATLRKILKEILDHLQKSEDLLQELMAENEAATKTAGELPLTLGEALTQIHFPDAEENVVDARERLAIEELLALIRHSQELKEEWKEGGAARKVKEAKTANAKRKTGEMESGLPFTLTAAQDRCIKEILTDVASNVPMNRLLIGDVGSGKTAVAGVACRAILASGYNAVLASPTRILAEQHLATFQKLFPDLRVELVTGKTKKFAKTARSISPEPTLYIGTHAVFNNLAKIKPALLIYDEQHRFGVTHRSLAQHLRPRPHILTLSATPIPRTLMLTIFSHLSLSVIDELPPGRQPVKTWLVPEKKREDAYGWIRKQIQSGEKSEQPAQKVPQALIVCPFIDPSQSEALENVAAATETFAKIKKHFAGLQVTLLHGRTPKKQQAEITEQLYDRKIDILVTTPIVEVGVDLPAATIIVIEAAERFGLASLHQLRGRVGRAGQQAYCLLFTTTGKSGAHQRLKEFCAIHDGMKLAEMDLQHRGAGDIFGTQQHGFDELKFANWTNLELIAKAKKISELIAAQLPNWQPFFEFKKSDAEAIPLAN